ncbi:hypothetical protein HZB93_01720 [Candidatus Falkowbacteria bacterium]|nr:hypothetical protein [Candidatus Falkowbacteria bacterium]
MAIQDQPTDFSEGQLKFASWYVSHKILLKKILIGFLIFLNAILLGYGLYGLVNYYFIEGPKFAAEMRELSSPIDYSAINQAAAPKNFEIGTTTIFSSGKERYDFVAKIFNPNSGWRAEFTYDFLVDGTARLEKNGFTLPGEEKFIFDLGVSAKSKPRQAVLEIKNLQWKRINVHEIPDYAAWQDERLNFIVENVKFTPAAVQENALSISRASFTARNASAFSFWDVGFAVLLYRGSSLAGVNYITLEEFRSGQNRPVEVSWFETLPSISQVKVMPEVNIFDPKVFMPVD